MKGYHADVQHNAFFIGWLLPLLVACVFFFSLSLTHTHAKWVVLSHGMAWHYISKLLFFFSPIKSVFVERQNNILLKAGERCFMSNSFPQEIFLDSDHGSLCACVLMNLM